jgi:esterase/lipase superfamily enzyme
MRNAPLARVIRTILLLTSLLAIGCAAVTPRLAPTPTMLVGSDENPFAETPADLQTPSVPLIYATDRAVKKSTDGHVEYGIGRSHALTIGVCEVTIGDRELTWERLVKASRSPKRDIDLPLRLGRTTPVATFAETGNPPMIVDGHPVPTPEDARADADATAALHALLRDRLAGTPRKHVYVFVHGYANRLEDGATRMVQLWHYLGRQGAAAIYSWPAGSPGLLRGYTHDRESGEFTVFHFKQFIRAVAASPDVEQIHLVGHSRGTDVLITTLRELLQQAGDPKVATEQLKLGHLILAAPDLDMEVSTQRVAAERLGLLGRSATVYLHAGDRALGISDWLFESARRVGQMQLTDLTSKQREGYSRLTGVSFIDVRVKTDRRGHGYFTDNPHVLSDLILLLRDGRPPGAEHGRPLLKREGAFWELHEGYPAESAPAGSD